MRAGMAGVIADPDDVPMPDRRLVDLEVVQRLIASQFPQWTDLPVRPVASSGWDNQTFHLGDHMSIRLPTAREYALAVTKEHQWLPVLATQVPLRIPVPIAKGVPGEGFAFPWSVYEWIDAEPASTAGIGDPSAFAERLAGFLAALRAADPVGGPEPGLHSWYRGGSLRVWDRQAREAIEALGGHVPRDAVTEIWESALRSDWDGQPVWFHGDVALGNLLVRDGALAAVIDFGTCGVGDPSCDLAIAWTVLSGAAREAFRSGIGADDGTWARGRGWALWKTLTTYARELRYDDAESQAEVAEARRVLGEILA
ncbi:aminoglycoside phosphotransferase family protein [Longispora albida]|uniref:aminoglycoside phosphotransferase family protein n=1 Tax=Longispora albida TaxID=203523 RepID=UPI0003A8112A